MITGFLLVLVSGLLWCGNAIAFSYIAIKKLRFVNIIGVQATVAAVLAWIFLPDFNLMRTGEVPKLEALTTLLISAGLILTFGIVIMQRAMQIGHHGIVYTVSQAAMIWPFLYGVFMFHEPLTVLKLSGMVFVLTSLVIFGRIDHNRSDNPESRPGRFWFFLAMLAFFCLGLHQTMVTLQSYWPEWSDVARLRIPIITTGCALGFMLIMLYQRHVPTKREWWFGVLVTPIAFISHITFFKGIDIMAQHSMVSLVYPLAVGINVISFNVYSMFFIKEQTTHLGIVGVLAGLTGLMIISF